jgi:hypothetical protein
MKQPVWDVIHVRLEIWKVRVEIHLRFQVKSDSHWAYYNETHACAATVLQRTPITTLNKKKNPLQKLILGHRRVDMERLQSPLFYFGNSA